MMEVRRVSDPQALARVAAEQFVHSAAAAIARHRLFYVALAGGSTPRLLHNLLATSEFATRIDWPRVHVFWGDERCVPHNHLGSNYRMAREAFLDLVPLPRNNVHPIAGGFPPKEAAVQYERVLKTVFSYKSEGTGSRTGDVSAGVPRFDLILLGMGVDGHTASLFPGTPAISERRRLVVAHYVRKLSTWRVTFTPILINAAVDIIVSVSGVEKAERLAHVVMGHRQPEKQPIQIVEPTDGRLIWLVDDAAAELLGDAYGQIVSDPGGPDFQV